MGPPRQSPRKRRKNQPGSRVGRAMDELDLDLARPAAKRIKLERSTTPSPSFGSQYQSMVAPDSKPRSASSPRLGLTRAGQLAQVLACLLPTSRPERVYRRPVVAERALAHRATG